MERSLISRRVQDDLVGKRHAQMSIQKAFVVRVVEINKRSVKLEILAPRNADTRFIELTEGQIMDVDATYYMDLI